MTATTDANGTARVPWQPLFSGTARVTATVGAFEGSLALRTDEPLESEHELRLAPTQALRVAARRADGSPAVGMRVELGPAPLDLAADATPPALMVTHSDADGEARFDDVEWLREQLARRGEQRHVALTVCLPGQPLTQRLPLPWPSEPIVVQLPPTGFVHVLLRDRDGALVDGIDAVAIHPIDTAITTELPRTQRDGTNFEVPLGRRWQAGALGFGDAEVEGPRSADEVVEATAVHRDDAMHVRARILVPGRWPQRLELRYEQGSRVAFAADDGFVCLQVLRGNRSDTYDDELQWRDEVDGRLWIHPLRVPLQLGHVVALGDLVLREAEPQLPLLVTGRVIDQRPPERRDQPLPMLRAVPAIGLPIGRFPVRPRADGSFAIHDEGSGSNFVLLIDPNEGDVGPIPFAAGQRGLEITLR
ncbi:MAG: hypothetical protein H6835_02025 [Planctomycetes bacterium]|nr:hypothetical protein [Planctomycetota bacterium]